MRYDFWKKQYSEEEIREYIKKYPENLYWNFWYDISRHQILSEDFIRDFQDVINWYKISAHQNLSEEFLIEFIEKVEVDKSVWGLMDNTNIPEDVKKRIINFKKLLEIG